MKLLYISFIILSMVAILLASSYMSQYDKFINYFFGMSIVISAISLITYSFKKLLPKKKIKEDVVE